MKPMTIEQFAMNSDYKIVRKYGVTSGRRFARIEGPHDFLVDVIVRADVDGSEETRVREIRKLAYPGYLLHQSR